jgi:transcription elongation factor Elf1
MKRSVVLAAILTFAAILIGPFLISDNSVAQALFGIITTALATGIGVWASWNHAKSADQERLTRYGLLAWRNIDALSVKLRQQMLHGSAKPEVLESWLLDIDGAKWAWRDLLREVFELQERLTLETEEVALEYKQKIGSATDETERIKLENEFRLAMVRIRNRAPLPIAEKELVDCPNCGAEVAATLGSENGSTTWPECDRCGALFPIHRKSDGEVSVNAEASKLLVKDDCPSCGAPQSWKVPSHKPVRFLFRCTQCDRSMQCDGTSQEFRVSVPDDA